MVVTPVVADLRCQGNVAAVACVRWNDDRTRDWLTRAAARLAYADRPIDGFSGQADRYKPSGSGTTSPVS
jgi:hypothetical protein